MVASNFPNPNYEMFVDGAWTSVTSSANVEGGTTYARGRRAEGSSTDFGSATIFLDNLDGKFSNRNPSSPYFGKIGRNTPFRQSLQVPDHFLNVPTGATSAVYTTVDAAPLDIVGDIDLRVEIAPDWWTGYSSTLTSTGWTICTKWASAGNRSWWWGITADGRAEFGWSADGTASLVARSTESVRASPGARVSLRVTLDVNNGASGNTVTFYTGGGGVNGTWDALGSPVIQAGVTSIFNSTVAVWVGDDSSTIALNTTIGRKIYRYQIRSSIGGTIVANPDWTTQTVGAGAFTDSAGRSWTATGQGTIMDRVYRFVTEGSEWSPRWGIGGRKVITPVETSGILRRLDQGTKPVESTLHHHYLNWVNPFDAPKAYWPMEDGKFTVSSPSPIPGCASMEITNMTMGANDTCPPSAPLPTLTSASRIQAVVPIHTLNSAWQIEMTVRMDNAPANNSTLFEFTTNGAPWTIWRMQVSSGLMQLVVESGDGATTLVFATFNPIQMFGIGWVKFTIFVFETPPDLFVVASWQPLLEMGLGLVSANSTTVNNTTAGRILNIDTKFGKELSGASVGHLAVWDSWTVSDNPAENAFNGDIAGTRMINLSSAKDVPFFGVGSLAKEEAVGYQRAETYLDLMREAEGADGGALCEDRTTPGLLYRDRASMYTQIPALIIPYGHLTTPIDPTDDDQRIRNRTTVNRKDGSSRTVSLDTGPMSTQDYPDGVGLYDQSVTVSLASDSRTETMAGWLNHHGTWNESRYPHIRLLLHDHPEYIKDILGIDTGSIIRITDTPPWLPPGPIDLMVEGYSETTRPHWWEITFACSPAGPWNVAVTNGAGYSADNFGRADTSGSKIGRDHTTTDDTLIVYTEQPITRDTKPKWTETASHYPMLLEVGGELVSAPNCAPHSFDNFNRTVANGWGTADSGQAWVNAGGVASERSVNGTLAIITHPATTSLRRQMISAEPTTDCEVSVVVSVSQTATGGSLTPGIIARLLDGSNYYRLRMHFTTGGNTNLSVTRAGTQINSNVTLPWTYAPGTQFNMRMRLVGHRVLGKAWPLTAAEPVDWQVSEVISPADGQITSGDIGLAAIALTGNTNVNPEFRYDNFLVYNPQRFYGCTRSVNGIVKPHLAGKSSVNVANPAIAGL